MPTYVLEWDAQIFIKMEVESEDVTVVAAAALLVMSSAFLLLKKKKNVLRNLTGDGGCYRSIEAGIGKLLKK